MISVCMATYNGELYIEEQINSILVQLLNTDELIISDDGSIDRTIEIIKSFNDDRIKLLINNSKCYTKNFENALSKAKGDYIFLSDQDDVWLPNKVKVTLEYLKNYDFVVNDATVVNEKLKILYKSRNKKFKIRKGFLNNFIKSYYLGCCMAFNKKVLEAALPFPKNNSLCLHDTWISLLSEKYFRTYIIEEPLIYYRRHDNNVSNGAEKWSNSILNILKIRLYLFYSILRRKSKIKKIYREDSTR